MKEKALTVVIMLLMYSSLSAQTLPKDWSREDSLWLLNVLEGKQELKINEETMKAIEAGRLIVPQWLKDQGGIDIMKDLTAKNVPDSVRLSRINPYTMPPAVFAMYVLFMDKVDSVLNLSKELLSDEERANIATFVPPNSRNRLFVNELGGGVGGLDFNHILSMIFSPAYRQKAQLVKHATAYKNYNGDGYEYTYRLTETEKRQINRAARKVKVDFIDHFGQKTNPIDN